MVDPGGSQTFWLNLLNVALGVATVVPGAVLGWVIVAEIVDRLRTRRPADSAARARPPRHDLAMHPPSEWF